MDPAKFACESLGLTPLGEPSEKPFVCRFTGYLHDAGTPVLPGKVSSSFMDAPELSREGTETVRDEGLMSGYVSALMSKPVMAKIFNSLITSKGGFKIAKAVHRKHFLLNLPEPPFLVACGASMNVQHVVWRTPVALSKEVFPIRVGQRIWTVRMDRVRRMIERLHPKERMLRQTDGWLQEMSCGKPVLKNLGELYREEWVAELGPGEWWAYATIIAKGEPEQPPVLTF